MAVVKKNEMHLTSIPEELTKQQSIYINVGDLNFASNDFEEIPEQIKLFSSMKKVDFSSNKLTSLSDHLFTIKGIDTMKFNQNKITEINPKITNLLNLTSLEMCANKLHEFNFNLNVKRLDLSANFFTTLSFNATSLTFLDISQNDLTSFPVLDCPNLEKINASYNNIETLPDSITQLSSLKSCDLRNNKITSLPKCFSLMTALTLLQLSNNPISGVPPNFETMKIRKLFLDKTQNFLFKPIVALKELHYSGVGADILFDDYSAMKNLETLDVSENNFRDLMVTSNKMIFLNASHNKLTRLSLAKDCTVQRIIARHNELASLDESIANSPKLGLLDISNNKLTNLPTRIELPKLYSLSLGFNKLTSLDVDLAKFANTLTFLDISYNDIKVLPPSIGALTMLKTLYICGNQIATLPPEFANLQALTNFHCANNQFSQFPQVLLQLTQLKKLYISSNHLETLPPLSVLESLHTLDCSNCFLSSATSIVDMPHLDQLNLSNNYLSTPHDFKGCSNLAYVDLSYNSLQKVFDATAFPKLMMLDVSFNDLLERPKNLPSTVVRTDGCVYLQKFPYLPRFNRGLKFKNIPTSCSASQMCADREEMQDSFICIPHFAAPEHYLFAAVDGHSGRTVSYVFSQRFPDIFYRMLESNNGGLTIEEALYQSFDAIQQEYIKKMKE